MTKQVAKRAKMEVAKFDYGSDDGAGFENQTREDFAIPFVNLLQSLSDEVTGANGKGIEGARPGLLLNSVTRELRETMDFIPCLTEHIFVEWRPRTSGGGFVAKHAITSEVVAKAKKTAETTKSEFGKFKSDAGNDLVETFSIYGIVSDEETGELCPVIVAFTSTKIKVYRRLMTTINMLTIPTPDGGKQRPPLFAHLLRISSSNQTNKKGTFKNLVIEPTMGNLRDSLLAPDDLRFEAAKELRNSVLKGEVKVAYDTQSSGDEATEAGDGNGVF